MYNMIKDQTVALKCHYEYIMDGCMIPNGPNVFFGETSKHLYAKQYCISFSYFVTSENI